MAARAQADQDIEPSRGLRNQLTQRAGEHFVAAEVNRRGAIAAALSGNLAGIDIIAFDGARSREVHLQVKTKTDSRFVWRMQVPDERVPEPKDEREFYVFVDPGTGANALPGCWIAPRSWVQNMVYDHKQAWLKKRGSRARDADSKHSGIKTEQLEGGRTAGTFSELVSSSALARCKEGYAMRTNEVIVRWGLAELSGLLEEVGMKRPFIVASDRWSHLDLRGAGRWREVPTDRIGDVAEAARGSDGLVVVGGGSAIDLAKAVSSATGLRVVSVPTTYAGAEWTYSFAIRNLARRLRGVGSEAHLAGIVYEPRLTLDLPRGESGGTAMNALAHCAEALYVAGRNAMGDEHALEGARLIGESLPRVLSNGHDLAARKTLLEGAMHGGVALAAAGFGLAHAMAQAVGGLYGIPHGTANSLCLPPALRFNASVAEVELARFGHALGVDDPAARCEELSRLSGYGRLRDLGVPEDGLRKVAEVTASRPGALANPRPASPQQILELFGSIW